MTQAQSVKEEQGLWPHSTVSLALHSLAATSYKRPVAHWEMVRALQDNLYNKGTAFVTQVVGVAVIRVWIRPLLPMLLARLAWAEGEERVKEEKGQWN